MSDKPGTVLQQMCNDVWWLVLLRGITAILLGIMLFTSPAATVTVFIMFLGVYWFVDGVVTLIASIKGRKSLSNWGWGIIVGILGILAGVVVFSQPLASAVLTTTFLIYFLAFTVGTLHLFLLPQF